MTAGDTPRPWATTLVRDKRAPAAARRHALAAANHLLTEHRRANLELLVSEVVTNAVLHGGGDITVIVRVQGDVVQVEVSDGGPALPRRRSTTGADGGFGLRLLEELSVTWGVEAGPAGKTVWFRV